MNTSYSFMTTTVTATTVTAKAVMAKARKGEDDSVGRPQRKSVEDVTTPRENQDPGGRRNSGEPKDSENPPNENLNKDPDEVYGDTKIPNRRHSRSRQ